MPGHRPSVAVALAVAAVLASGCAHSPAPDGWLPAADAAGSDAFGGWLVAEVGTGRDHRRHIEGELIAVGADSLFVLTPDGYTGMPRAEIVEATVAGYDIDAGALAAWATLGTLSTLSHGVRLGLTAPVWVLTGAIASRSANHAPLVTYPPWDELTPYARFPQGLPAGLDPATLKQKRPLSESEKRRSVSGKPHTMKD